MIVTPSPVPGYQHQSCRMPPSSGIVQHAPSSTPVMLSAVASVARTRQPQLILCVVCRGGGFPYYSPHGDHLSHMATMEVDGYQGVGDGISQSIVKEWAGMASPP